MMIERARFVYVSENRWNDQFAALAEMAAVAARRHENADPGDRREAVRFASLCDEIERRAIQLDVSGQAIPSFACDVAELPDVPLGRVRLPWFRGSDRLPKTVDLVAPLDAGGYWVEIRNPFGGPGPARTRIGGLEIPPSAQAWQAPKGQWAPSARWREQLVKSMTNREPIVPSGISNRTISTGLREFVCRRSGVPPFNAPVIYRDGSEAEPFPLASVDLSAVRPQGTRVLKVALLSMRHPEMDAKVDGCWLRNRDISVSRPAGDTDRVVTKRSREQLAALTASGPIVIELFQTGLEPAVMGFYRAVAEFMRDDQRQPTHVSVIPQFYSKRSDSFSPGDPWVAVR